MYLQFDDLVVGCSLSLVAVLQLVGCDFIENEDDGVLELYEDGPEDKVEDVRHDVPIQNILQCLIMKIVILIISYKWISCILELLIRNVITNEDNEINNNSWSDVYDGLEETSYDTNVR